MRRSSISASLAVGLLVLCGAFAATAPAASPLAGEWPLESSTASGATESTADTSGNGLSLAGPAGTMHFGTDGGKFGGYLTGSSATTMQVTSPLLAPPQVTLLAWIKQSGYPGLLRYIAGRGNDGGNCGGSSYALYTGYSAIPGLHFYVRQQDAGATPVVSDSPPDSAVFDGNWHLVAGTYDGANIRLYLDGTQIGAPKPAAGVGYGSPIGDPSFYVDGYPPQSTCVGNSDFPGQIDEVRVYDRALTATELQRLAAATGPTPPQLTPDGPPPLPELAALPFSALVRAGKTVRGVSKRPADKALQGALQAARTAGIESMASGRGKSLIGKPKKVTGLSGKERSAVDPDPGIQGRLKAMRYGIGMRFPAGPGDVIEVAATVALERDSGAGVTTQTIVLPPVVGSPSKGQTQIPFEIPVDAPATAAMANHQIAAASISIQAVELPNPETIGGQSTQLSGLLKSTSSDTVDLSEALRKLEEAQKEMLEAERKEKEKLASQASERSDKLSKEIRKIEAGLDESAARAVTATQAAWTTMATGLITGALGVAGTDVDSSQLVQGIIASLNPCGYFCTPGAILSRHLH